MKMSILKPYFLPQAMYLIVLKWPLKALVMKLPAMFTRAIPIQQSEVLSSA